MACQLRTCSLQKFGIRQNFTAQTAHLELHQWLAEDGIQPQDLRVKTLLWVDSESNWWRIIIDLFTYW